MAYPIHGKVTHVEKNSVTVDNEVEFNLAFSIALAEIQAKGDNWKKHLAGIGEWGGDMAYHFDPSNTEQRAFIDNIVTATPGTKLTDVEFNLEDSDDYFSGDIFIMSMPVRAPMGDKVSVSFTFKGDGAPDLTIA